eukprot:NODE_371_length_9954_cov_0.100355.p7 type:complete len:199 gc:universal NODE_371_length_9954_cov_0.100355:2504-1908(-)
MEISLLHEFIEKWIYNILHLRKVYPYHSFERSLKNNMQCSFPRMSELQKYISEMLVGINLEDVEEINLVITQGGNPIEKFGIRIANYSGTVDVDKFWHQARGVFLKLCSFDAMIGEATELSEKEYSLGKRSFYIVAMTNGRYPCNELDEWVPAEASDLSLKKPSVTVSLRTIENSEFKLESFAVIPDDEVVSNPQETF